MADDQVKVDILTNTQSSIVSVAKYAAAIGAATIAVNKALSVAKDLVKAYGVQEDAEKKLAAAIRVTGGRVNDQLSSYKTFASELQNVTTVGDETTLALIAQATQLGINEDLMEQSIEGVVGLSEALGIDLNTALRGVANAQEGNFGMLERYIPALRTAGSEAEKTAILNKLMADSFEIAKETTQTTTGGLKQLSNAIGDMKEQYGASIAEAINPFVKEMTAQVTKMNQARQAAMDLKAVMEQGLGESSIDQLKSALIDAQKTLDAVNVSADESTMAMTGLAGATQAEIDAAEALVASLEKQIQIQENFQAGLKLNKGYSEEFRAQKQAEADAALEAERVKQEAAEAALQEEQDRQQRRIELYAESDRQIYEASFQLAEQTSEAEQAAFDRSMELAEREKEAQKEVLESKKEALNTFYSGWMELIALAAQEGGAAAEMFKWISSAEAAIASYLAFTKALAAAPWPFNFAAASGVLAAGLAQQAKIHGTNIPKFAQGGEFVTQGPQAIMVGDNATGRERVKVEPMGAGRGGSRELVIPVILNGRELGRAITVMSDDGQILINSRSVK